jgi:hypothetical protein
MFMPPADWALMAAAQPQNIAVPFVMPLYPDIPQYTQAATSEEAQEMKALYEVELQDHANATGLRAQIKHLIMKAVPETAIKRLKHSIHGYSDVTPAQILDHLMTKYGTIEPEDLEANLEKLVSPWDPSTDILNVFNNALECQQYSIFGEDPISDDMLIRKTVKVMEASGVFVHEVKEWNNKAKADKTFANLETHFENANKHRLLSEKSLKETLAAHQAQTKTKEPEADTPAEPSFGYCHTHGFCKNLGHTSASCKFPGTSHKKEATSQNKMGGSTSMFVPRSNGTNLNKKKKDDNAATKAAAKVAREAAAAAQTAATATAVAEAVKAALAAFLTENNQ